MVRSESKIAMGKVQGNCSLALDRYAKITASKGGARRTPQNGNVNPNTIGVKIDAQTGTFDVRFMIIG